MGIARMKTGVKSGISQLAVDVFMYVTRMVDVARRYPSRRLPELPRKALAGWKLNFRKQA
jgi:hypothetical protein